MQDVKHILEYLEDERGDIAIPGCNLVGFVSHEMSIGADGDIDFGGVNTATIKVSITGLKGDAASYKGRRFIYTKGYAEKETRQETRYSADILVQNEDWYAYTAENRLYYKNGVIILPSKPGGLVLRPNSLTVLYPGEPYAEVYTTTGGQLAEAIVPDMQPYDREIAVQFSRRKQGYVVMGHTCLVTNVENLLGKRYVSTIVYELHTRGVFTIDKPVKGTGGVYTLSGVDAMSRITVDMTELVKTIPTNATAGQVLQMLCDKAAVPLADQTRLNETMQVAVPVLDSHSGINGGTLLAWLGEIMGCSWRINPLGALTSVWYADTAKTVTMSEYASLFNEDFIVPSLGKVVVASVYEDVAGEAGDTAGAVLIADNGFVGYTKESDLEIFAASLLPKTEMIQPYSPGELSTYCSPDIAPGDLLEVATESSLVNLYVTKYVETGYVASVTSSGNDVRDITSYGPVSGARLKKTLSRLTQQVMGYPSAWNAQIEETVNLITGGMGGTRVDLFDPVSKRPSGTAYLYDSSDIRTAKELLVLNAGGIAFYDKGFNIDNPSQSVPKYVVMNSKGQVNASTIVVGVLRSANGETSLNMLTGSLKTQSEYYSQTLDAVYSGGQCILSLNGVPAGGVDYFLRAGSTTQLGGAKLSGSVLNMVTPGASMHTNPKTVMRCDASGKTFLTVASAGITDGYGNGELVVNGYDWQKNILTGTLNASVGNTDTLNAKRVAITDGYGSGELVVNGYNANWRYYSAIDAYVLAR